MAKRDAVMLCPIFGASHDPHQIEGGHRLMDISFGTITADCTAGTLSYNGTNFNISPLSGTVAVTIPYTGKVFSEDGTATVVVAVSGIVINDAVIAAPIKPSLPDWAAFNGVATDVTDKLTFRFFCLGGSAVKKGNPTVTFAWEKLNI